MYFDKCVNYGHVEIYLVTQMGACNKAMAKFFNVH